MNYLIGMFQSSIEEFISFIQNLSLSQIVGLAVLSFILLLFYHSFKRMYKAYKKNRANGSNGSYSNVDTKINKGIEQAPKKKRRGVDKEINIAAKKRAEKFREAKDEVSRINKKQYKGGKRKGVVEEINDVANSDSRNQNTTLSNDEENVSELKSTNNEKENEINKTDSKSLGKDKSLEIEDSNSSKANEHKVRDKTTNYGSIDNSDKRVTKKGKKGSKPITDSIQKPETKNEILYIGYEPTDKFVQQEDWEYAVIKMPQKNSVIRQPVEGKQQVRGYKEKGFQNILESLFPKDFTITGNALISTGNETRPYEPDICISCLLGGRNIFIDVEIDEPYGGITRNATHIEEEDDIRDYYFTDRGWIVIRFAEIQVHKQPQECAGLIAKAIKEIAPELNLPGNLLAKKLPATVEQWDILQAQEWESDNYRESYLNHNFGHQDVLNKGDSAVELREIDLEVEKEVIPTTYLQEEHEPTSGQINIKNWSERDNRIQFFPEKHVYLINGVQAKSVTEVVERFFPAFDSQGISRRLSKKRGVPQSEILESWDRARDQGTHLHVQIENYFNNDEYDEPSEFEYFLNFMNDHSDLNTFRTEWRVFDDKRLMAGTIDYVAKNNDGTFSIYDWKRSKNVVDEWNGGGPKTSHPFGNGFGSLRHIDSTSYNKYCLQQGVYKEILERFYGITIRDMHLVVIHPRYSDYHKFKVPYWSDEINHIMKSI